MAHKRESDSEEFDPKTVRNGNGSLQKMITWTLGTVIALFTIAGFAYKGIADYAYPKSKGETLEQVVKEIRDDMKVQTAMLTDVRLIVAGERAVRRNRDTT